MQQNFSAVETAWRGFPEINRVGTKFIRVNTSSRSSEKSLVSLLQFLGGMKPAVNGGVADSNFLAMQERLGDE